MTEEFPAIRCYGCGKPTDPLWGEYQYELKKSGNKATALCTVFEKYNLKKCCRCNLMTPDVILSQESLSNNTFGVETQYSASLSRGDKLQSSASPLSKGPQVIRTYLHHKRVTVDPTIKSEVIIKLNRAFNSLI